MLKRLLEGTLLGRRDKERGQSTAEFVLMVPFLFLLFFLIVDFGWLFKNWIVVTNTARETTRCAAVDRCIVDGAFVTPEEFALEQMRGGLGSNLFDSAVVQLFYVDTDGDGDIRRGDNVVVCIAAENEFISPVVPFLSVIAGGTSLGDSLALKARNEMRVERAPLGASPDPGGGDCGF